ncbi:hypothetical protein DRQ33_02775, partial [bacterium]
MRKIVICAVMIISIMYAGSFYRIRSTYDPQDNVSPPPTALDSTEAVYFQWDDGSPSSYYTLYPDDILANKFTTEHPCSIMEISVYLDGGGDTELHIWADFSNQPDTTEDLITPTILTFPDSAGWFTISLDTICGAVEIPPLTTFHIGFRGMDTELRYYIAGNNTAYVTHYYDSGENTWYVIGTEETGHPMMLRAVGIYYDILTEFWFTDVTTEAGITDGSHISVGDIDDDYYPDMLIGGNIWYNNRDGTFSNVYTIPSGRTFFDYDNDGDLDVIATDDRLWRNDGTGFTDVSSTVGAALLDTCPFMSPGIGDFDKDGDLDIYVANGEQWMGDYGVYFPDFYYVNEAGTVFVEATDSVGMGLAHTYVCYGRIVVVSDFDDDFDLDMYVGNYRLHPNYLFINNGDGTFSEHSMEYGVTGNPVSYGGAVYFGHTIGAQWVDIDNDTDFDLFVANLAHPRFISFSDKSMLYINQGPSDYHFDDQRNEWNIGYYETHSSCVFGDFDNDGWQDLYISCVYDGYHSFLYRNTGDYSFELVNYESGIFLNNSWGCAWMDYDNDGDLDLCARHTDTTGSTQMRLFRNDIENGNNWIKLKLEGTISDKYAIGAVARVYSSALGFWQTRQVDAVVGTEGTSQGHILHFGLGTSTIVETLIVKWITSEMVDTFIDLSPNRLYRVIEGVGIESIYEQKKPIENINIVAYPNPFNETCNISVRFSEDIGSLSIVDINGRIVLNREIRRGSNTIKFDCSE